MNKNFALMKMSFIFILFLGFSLLVYYIVGFWESLLSSTLIVLLAFAHWRNKDFKKGKKIEEHITPFVTKEDLAIQEDLVNGLFFSTGITLMVGLRLISVAYT